MKELVERIWGIICCAAVGLFFGYGGLGFYFDEETRRQLGEPLYRDIANNRLPQMMLCAAGIAFVLTGFCVRSFIRRYRRATLPGSATLTIRRSVELRYEGDN
jgi:hypothetical protein